MFAKGFCLKTVAWISLATYASAGAAAWGGDSASCPLDPTDTALISGANANLPGDLGRILDEVPPGQGDCFAELTLADQLFLARLADDQKQAIQAFAAQNCRGDLKLCDDKAVAQLNEQNLESTKAAVAAYHPGTVAQTRVLAAIAASRQKQQTLEVLGAVYSNPKTAAAFADFAGKIARTDFEFKRASYGGGWSAYPLELRDALSTSGLTSTSGPGLLIDGMYKVRQWTWGEQYGNPQVELPKAQAALAKSMDGLDKSIASLPSDQQSLIRSAAEGMVGQYDRNVQAAADDFQGHNAVMIMGIGAFGSAMAIAAAVPTLVGALTTVGNAPVLLTMEHGLIGGGLSGGGGAGVYQVSHTVSRAIAAAEDRQTGFACELGKRLAAHGPEILDSILDNTLKGAAMGAAMGGGMAITALHFPLLAAVVGTTRFATAVFQNGSSLHHDILSLVRQCPALAGLENQPGVTPEALMEKARMNCDEATADAVASVISDLSNSIQLAKGAHDVKERAVMIKAAMKGNYNNPGQSLALVSNSQNTSASSSANAPGSPSAPAAAPAPAVAVPAPPAAASAPNPNSPAITPAVTTPAAPVALSAPAPATVSASAPASATVSAPPAAAAPAPVIAPVTAPAAGLLATATGIVPVGSGPSVTLPTILTPPPVHPVHAPALDVSVLDTSVPLLEHAAAKPQIAAPSDAELARVLRVLRSQASSRSTSYSAPIGQARSEYQALRRRRAGETQYEYALKEAEFWREASARLAAKGHHREASTAQGIAEQAQLQAARLAPLPPVIEGIPQ